MGDAVIEWENIIHKNVRTKDLVAVGNIVGVDEESIIITTQGGMKEYVIPKTHVEMYDGSEVILDFFSSSLSIFEM